MLSYEESRWAFVSEYARGADPCERPKQQRWLERIKNEVRDEQAKTEMQDLQRAGNAPGR